VSLSNGIRGEGESPIHFSLNPSRIPLLSLSAVCCRLLALNPEARSLNPESQSLPLRGPALRLFSSRILKPFFALTSPTSYTSLTALLSLPPFSSLKIFLDC
jgi:hypothetical protein